MQTELYNKLHDFFGTVGEDDFSSLLDKEAKLKQNIILLNRETREVNDYLAGFKTKLEEDEESLSRVRQRIGELVVEYSTLADNSNNKGE